MRVAGNLICAMLAFVAVGCSKEPANDIFDRGNRMADTVGRPADKGAAPPIRTEVPVDGNAIVENCVAPEDRQRPIDDFTPEQKRALVACANQGAARQINARLPVRVDEITTVESITATGTRLTYNYRVDVNADDITPAARARLAQATRAQVCGRSDMQQTMALGGTYAYNWLDRSGRPIMDMVVDRC